MKKIITLTILALTAMLTAATAQTHRRWDFTHWSPATVANLMANAAVSGQGPKFAKTHFPGWQKGDPPVTATFRAYYIERLRVDPPAAMVPSR